MAPKAKAEEEPETAEGEEKPAKAKTSFLSKKMMIIAAAGLVAVGGGGFAAYEFLFSHGGDKHQEAAAKPATFVDMPDVLVNLSNPGNDRTQYLKVKITLELPSKEAVEKINPLMPRLVDAFQTYLRELRPTDLDGSAGLYRLKEELTRRVNLAVAPNKVTAVLFKEIVVQ
jgi:flagellar FliL protein